jgi:hypothetical protein
MRFSFDKKVGVNDWGNKYGMESGIYYWYKNFIPTDQLSRIGPKLCDNGLESQTLQEIIDNSL